jgi:hypothetical protein
MPKRTPTKSSAPVSESHPRICPSCTASLFEVTVKISDHPVTMLSCETCEYRCWRSLGESIGLSRAIELLRPPRAVKVALPLQRRKVLARPGGPSDQALLTDLRASIAA